MKTKFSIFALALFVSAYSLPAQAEIFTATVANKPIYQAEPTGNLIRTRSYSFIGKVTNALPNAKVFFFLQRPDGTMKYSDQVVNGESQDILMKVPSHYTDSNGNFSVDAVQTLTLDGQNGAWTSWVTVGGIASNTLVHNVVSAAVAESSPTITSFSVSDPKLYPNQAVTIYWNASGPTDATLDVVCPIGLISFYDKESNSYPSCEKGGIAYYRNQSYNAVTLQPRGNSQTVSVNFVLTLLKNGVPVANKIATVTFAPAVASFPPINSFTANISNDGGYDFYWSAAGGDWTEFRVPCYAGLAITTHEGSFVCGDIDRRVASSGSLHLHFTNQSYSVLNIHPVLEVVKSGGPATRELSINIPLAGSASSPQPVSDSNNQQTIQSILSQIALIQKQIASLQAGSPAPALPLPPVGSEVSETDVEQFSYAFKRSLYFGLRNDPDVTALQNALLLEKLYTGPVTGNFLKMTLQAVREFQRKYGIEDTGFVGALTRAKLNELYSQ